MSWEDKTTVKKGNIGERIVSDYLNSKGFIIYEPKTDGSHGFDRIIQKRDKNEIYLAIVEIKSKSRRIYLPDTGINYNHYLEYIEFSKKYNLPFFR